MLIAACATTLMQENEAEAGIYFHAGVGFGIGHGYPAYGYGYAPAYYAPPVYAAPAYYAAPVTTLLRTGSRLSPQLLRRSRLLGLRLRTALRSR